MRRRALGDNELVNLTLSSSSKTISATTTSDSFIVYNNGDPLTKSSVTLTRSSSWITSATWNASTSTVSIVISKNTDACNSRSATITVKYKGNNINYTLTQSKSTTPLIKLVSWNGYDYDDCAAFGGEGSFLVRKTDTNNVTSNYVVNRSDSWITTTKSGATIYYTCADYDGSAGSHRYGYIYVNNTDGSCTTTASATVFQYANVCDVMFSDGTTYSYGSWPSNKTPIGLVMPSWTYSSTTYPGICLSLKYMSCSTPDSGTVSSETICWGGSNYSVGSTAWGGGSANANLILSVDNSNSTAWQTASTISNEGHNKYIHPAAQCCWRYHTEGTSQGDWYLPSEYDLRTFAHYFFGAIAAITALKRQYSNVSILNMGSASTFGGTYWCSTQSDNSHARNLYVRSSYGGYDYKYRTYPVLAVKPL